MASDETQFLASWISHCSVPAWWFVLHETLRLLTWWVTGLGGQLKSLAALKYLFLKKKKDGHGDDDDDDDYKENGFSRVTILKSWTHPAKMTQIMGLFFFLIFSGSFQGRAQSIFQPFSVLCSCWENQACAFPSFQAQDNLEPWKKQDTLGVWPGADWAWAGGVGGEPGGRI